MVIVAFATCCAGLARVQAQGTSSTSEAFKKSATVVEDAAEAKTKISSENASRSGNDRLLRDRSYLRAYVNDRSGTVTYQVSTRTQYTATKYRLYRTAYFQTARGTDSAPVVVLSRSSGGCDAYGKCEYREDSGFYVDEAVLRAVAKDYALDPSSASPWTFRLKNKSGDQLDGYLLDAEIAGLLARVDEYFADNKLARGRPNTVEAPLLSPLNNMVAFGIQGANKSELAPAIAAALGTTELKGIFVVTVSPGSLAEFAGVKAGDDLYEFNGKTIGSSQQMQAAVAGAAAGTSVPIKVLRNGAPVSMVAQF
jgi:PDZ domain